jgi:hypothetical protein
MQTNTSIHHLIQCSIQMAHDLTSNVSQWKAHVTVERPVVMLL